MITLEFLRSFKIGQYAIFDLTVSFLGIYLLAPLLSRLFRLVNLDIPTMSWLLFTLPLSIFIHVLVGKSTPMTNYFLDASGHYFIKLIMIVLLILAVKMIKFIK